MEPTSIVSGCFRLFYFISLHVKKLMVNSIVSRLHEEACGWSTLRYQASIKSACLL